MTIGNLPIVYVDKKKTEEYLFTRKWMQEL